MNEDGILYYLFLFFTNLGIFVSLTTLMVLKGWLPYPSGESKSETEQIGQQSSETRFINNISTDVVLPVDSAGSGRKLATTVYYRKNPIPNVQRNSIK